LHTSLEYSNRKAVKNVFVAKAEADVNWGFNTTLKFVIFQLEQANRKEIVVVILENGSG
jgi:hypothetical protein